MNTPIFLGYIQQLDDLFEMVQVTERRTIGETGDQYFTDNLNFFTKSFLVIMCAYLESYLKEIAAFLIADIGNVLDRAKLPYNLLKWNFDASKELKDPKWEVLKIKITQEQIDDNISGDVYRTIKLMTNLGVNLSIDSEFQLYKDKIASIVTKRNLVVHHNDSASDVSYGDIKGNILILKSYLLAIDNLIIRQISRP